MYMLDTGFASSAMIGSASAWRSYGFTQGSMLPHPLSRTAHTASAGTRAYRRALAMTRGITGLRSKFTLTLSCRSLFQQRADLVQVLALIAGLVAAVQIAHVALAVDEHGARHGAHVVELAHLAVLVEHHRERH